MNSEWIDISDLVHNGMPRWPGDLPFERKLTQSLDRGGGANLSQICGSANAGTHMDACAGTMDTMPLEATVGRARVIEIKDAAVKHDLAFGERILFKTRNSAELWKRP